MASIQKTKKSRKTPVELEQSSEQTSVERNQELDEELPPKYKIVKKIKKEISEKQKSHLEKLHNNTKERWNKYKQSQEPEPETEVVYIKKKAKTKPAKKVVYVEEEEESEEEEDPITYVHEPVYIKKKPARKTQQRANEYLNPNPFSFSILS